MKSMVRCGEVEGCGLWVGLVGVAYGCGYS